LTITFFVFLFIFLIYFLIYPNLNEAIYIFIYFFTPIVYILTLISSINQKAILSSFLEGFLQNILLLFILFLFSPSFILNGFNELPINSIFFFIFASWGLVFMVGFSFLKSAFYFNFITIFKKYSLNNAYIFVNPFLLYILTKLDIFFLLNDLHDESLKYYYSTQKIAEIVQMGSDTLWLIFAPLFLKFINNKSLLNLIFNKYNKLNFLLLITISILLIFIFFINSKFGFFNYLDNIYLFLFFLILYALNNYFNIYYLLLVISKEFYFIFISLISTLLFTLCIFLFLKYVLHVSPIYLAISFISSFFLISKILFFLFYNIHCRRKKSLT